MSDNPPPTDDPVQSTPQNPTLPSDLPTTLSEADKASSLSPAPPLLPRTSKPKHIKPPPSLVQNSTLTSMIDPSLHSPPTLPPLPTLSITQSIALAPQPRTSDFTMSPMNDELDFALIERALEEPMPGSPTVKLMKAIAPANATQSEPKWNQPPPNASVNLFIGRALLANGNDNWPLKPNEIVSWIRRHYPSEWDGDEGRCSAHRVRTYLARKGTDMYYEKMAQGCVVGWRIRQNHIWRFENGGFQGRGMKQEEAIAQQQKENEAIVTAAHKAAAAEALAVGHPGIKVSMSLPGINDGSGGGGLGSGKRLKVNRLMGNGLARKKNTKSKLEEMAREAAARAAQSAVDGLISSHALGQGNGNGHASGSGNGGGIGDLTLTQVNGVTTGESNVHHLDPSAYYNPGDYTTSGPSHHEHDHDLQMVQQAMQAAAGQMDELEMGMQIPIEMQLHGSELEGDDPTFGFGVGVGVGVGGENTIGVGGVGLGGGQHQLQLQHPYTPMGGGGGFDASQYGYTGQNGVYGFGHSQN